MINQDPIAEVAHELESVYESLNKDKLVATEAIYKLAFITHEFIGQMLLGLSC